MKRPVQRVLNQIDKMEEEYNNKVSKYLYDEILKEIKVVREKHPEFDLQKILFGNGTALIESNPKYYFDNVPRKFLKLYSLIKLACEFPYKDIIIVKKEK